MYNIMDETYTLHTHRGHSAETNTSLSPIKLPMRYVVTKDDIIYGSDCFIFDLADDEVYGFFFMIIRYMCQIHPVKNSNVITQTKCNST